MTAEAAGRTGLKAGTPVVNRPEDLVAQLSIMGRLQEFGGTARFKADYCTDSKDKDVKPRVPLSVLSDTLYANCKKGNRPSFIEAGAPDRANELYEYVIGECRKKASEVQTGSFGAEMEVSLINDGPFTIILDSEKL